MEDSYGPGESVPWRARQGVVRAGLRERMRRLGREQRSPRDALRSGAQLVLCGWALAVVGGFAYAKVSEHWDQATPNNLRHLPAIGYNATLGASVIGALVVAVAAIVAVPSLLALLRAGGWRRIRRPVVRALAVVAVTIAYTVTVLALRPGGGAASGSMRLVGVAWALLVSLSVAALTAAVVAVARALPLSRRVLQVEGVLALALSAAVVVVTAGAALWWAATAHDTTILSGSRSGLFATPGVLSMSAATGLMVSGSVATVIGAARVARSLRGPSVPSTG
jgi:hypothetical protein